MSFGSRMSDNCIELSAISVNFHQTGEKENCLNKYSTLSAVPPAMSQAFTKDWSTNPKEFARLPD